MAEDFLAVCAELGDTGVTYDTGTYVFVQPAAVSGDKGGGKTGLKTTIMSRATLT